MLGKYGDKIEIDLARHFILNTIRYSVVKHKQEFGGDVVIACDSRRYWRKDIFPYYKGNRSKDRDASGVDWQGIFDAASAVKQELRDFFPYRVIEIDGAEGDDVIGVLVNHLGDSFEKTMLIGDDKDFFQLHTHINFHQYDPVKKKARIVCPNPGRYLKEQIIQGDGGDGIPNILSDDDTFMVTHKRQKPMRAARLETLMNSDPASYPEMELRNYKRNEQLIDLSFVPTTIAEKVLIDYNQQGGKDRSKLLQYFMDNRLRNLLENIGDF